MREIIMPFRIEDLIVRPEFAGRVQLSDDMQQTLASLVGYDGIGRRLLHSSKGGVLYQTTPRLGNIIHTVGVGTPRRYVGPDLSITEVMVMGHPDNGELLWVKNDEIATAANGWPLAAKEVVSFTLDNLNNLNLMFITADNKAIIAYTR